MSARDTQPAPERTTESSADSETRTRRRYVCAACGAVIADEGDEIAIDGAIDHERANPGAYVHRFVTLRRCDAGAPITPPTTEFAWFDGYAWQVLACGGCGVHLGWRFDAVDTRATPRFFGVLRARIKFG